MIFAGVGMFVANLIFMGIWAHTSEVAAKRLRESYLAAVLRQDIAFFDNVGAGEVATRIETDTRMYPHSFPSSPCASLIPYFQTLYNKAFPRRYLWEPVSWPLSSSVSSSHIPSNGNSPWPCPQSFP